MRPSTETHISMYRHLGRLFYAVAASDGVVHPAEIKTLKEIISGQWLKVDTYVDEYGTDTAHYISIVFDWLAESNASPTECLDAFVRFRKKHPQLFTVAMDKLVWDTANKIATAFAGRNKSELVMLSRLREALVA